MLQLKPSEIRYCQDSISCFFTGKHHGTKIGKTLDGLVDGDISVDTIPWISVTIRNGKWFTHDNRRLWVLKHFELFGGCVQVSVTKKGCLEKRKFTTYNEGTNIRVRGDPGGIWYNKYTRNPEIYRNFLQNQNINAHNESSAPTNASIVSDEVSLKALLGDFIVETIKIEPALEHVTHTEHITLKRKRGTADKARTYPRKHKSWSAYFSFSSTPSLSKMPAKPDLRHVFPRLMSQLNPISNAICTSTPSTSSALATAAADKIVSSPKLIVQDNIDMLQSALDLSKQEQEMKQFTTYNEGTDIRIRGDPGGIWYNKDTRNPEIYKHFLRNQNINAHNESSAPTNASIVSDEVSLKALLGDLIVDTIKIKPALEQVTNTEHISLKRKRGTADKARTYPRKSKSWIVYFSFSSNPSLLKMPAKPDLRHVFPRLMSQLNPISNAICTSTPSTSSALATAAAAKIVSSPKLIVQNNTDMLQSALDLSKQEPARFSPLRTS